MQERDVLNGRGTSSELSIAGSAMRKAAIREGDPTTTGGYVIAGTSTIRDGKRKVALSDDQATCGNCEGTYKIHGTGQGIKEKGRHAVVDNDIVLCPCKQNRVVIGKRPGIFLKSGAGSGNAHGASMPTIASVFDEQYVFRDRTNGRPLANVFYRLVSSNGVTVEGVTDQAGRTQRIKTSLTEKVVVEIEEAE
ncbi:MULTISPECIES: PAAR domain-containing protein [unclassified Caballeronia]|uniref:PAAR domain-containing protein n=1 Tax=unclassified Caballeronia TaxID=2646786 RepID=UPI0020294C04|nr:MULTISPECIES: PAAR domain-containing protein [unclassified Caballeronia]